LSDPLRLASLTLNNAATLTFTNGTNAATLQVDGNMAFNNTAAFSVYAGLLERAGRLLGHAGERQRHSLSGLGLLGLPLSQPFNGGSPLFKVGNVTVVRSERRFAPAVQAFREAAALLIQAGTALAGAGRHPPEPQSGARAAAGTAAGAAMARNGPAAHLRVHAGAIDPGSGEARNRMERRARGRRTRPD